MNGASKTAPAVKNPPAAFSLFNDTGVDFCGEAMGELILYPRANTNESVSPSRRTGGSFVSALINGRSNFPITHA